MSRKIIIWRNDLTHDDECATAVPTLHGDNDSFFIIIIVEIPASVMFCFFFRPVTRVQTHIILFIALDSGSLILIRVSTRQLNYDACQEYENISQSSNKKYYLYIN